MQTIIHNRLSPLEDEQKVRHVELCTFMINVISGDKKKKMTISGWLVMYHGYELWFWNWSILCTVMMSQLLPNVVVHELCRNKYSSRFPTRYVILLLWHQLKSTVRQLPCDHDKTSERLILKGDSKAMKTRECGANLITFIISKLNDLL